jgi:hypothetical protein
MFFFGILNVIVLHIFQLIFTKEEVLELVAEECKQVVFDLFKKSEISESTLLKSILYRIMCNVLAKNPEEGKSILEKISFKYTNGMYGFWQSVVFSCQDEYLNVRVASLMLINNYLKSCETLILFLLL